MGLAPIWLGTDKMEGYEISIDESWNASAEMNVQTPFPALPLPHVVSFVSKVEKVGKVVQERTRKWPHLVSGSVRTEKHRASLKHRLPADGNSALRMCRDCVESVMMCPCKAPPARWMSVSLRWNNIYFKQVADFTAPWHVTPRTKFNKVVTKGSLAYFKNAAALIILT